MFGREIQGKEPIIQNAAVWEERERQAIRSEPPDFGRNLALLEANVRTRTPAGGIPAC
jgi:hypothetical protein